VLLEPLNNALIVEVLAVKKAFDLPHLIVV
jgi:hypothetical protein